MAHFCCSRCASLSTHPQTGLNTNRSRCHSQEPEKPRTSRTKQNQQEQSVTKRRCCSHQPSGVVTNRHCNSHQHSPTILLLGTSVGGASSTTSAKSSSLIGAFLHETSNRPFSWSFSPDHRTRCNSQSTQSWLTTPCLGHWTNIREQPSAGTTEQKHKVPTEHQRATIASLFSPTRGRAS